MKKLTLSDFSHTEWSNRVFAAQEDVIEVLRLGDSIQVYVFHYPPGEIRDTHTHEEARLTFVRSGRMKLVLEDKILILECLLFKLDCNIKQWISCVHPF